MKRFAVITLLIFTSVTFLQGQSQRLVLAEEFTNASCGPCASQNPAFDALLQANEDIVTSIKYHTSWPGTDPMYSHNPGQSAARVSYYGVTGVPFCFIDSEPPTGGYYTGAPANVTQALLNAAAAVPSPFEMQFNQQLSTDQDSIYLTMIIEATDDVSGNLVVQTVVIEKEIHFAYPPGSNGEKDFYNVMKWMLPTASGTVLDNFEMGDYLILECAWKLANVYDIDQLAAVAFVQDNTTKAVHQSENSSINPLTPLYQYDAQVTTISNVAESNCTGSITPVVTIRNNGAATLTSLDFSYQVNGGEIQNYVWTGSLDFLQKATAELPGLNFEVLENNELSIINENPNGHPDEYVKNDTSRFDFQQAVITSDYITLTMRLDDNPEQTSWEVKNSTGDVIHSGGNYTQPNQFININLSFTDEDCYTFHIYDSGGDGFNTGGFCSVHVGSDVILQVTSFGSEAFNYFEYSTGVGITDARNDLSIGLYPNPVREELYVSVARSESRELKFRLIDLSGRTVKIIEQGVQAPGENIFIIPVYDIDDGLYLLETYSGKERVTDKISVKH